MVGQRARVAQRRLYGTTGWQPYLASHWNCLLCAATLSSRNLLSPFRTSDGARRIHLLGLSAESNGIYICATGVAGTNHLISDLALWSI